MSKVCDFINSDKSVLHNAKELRSRFCILKIPHFVGAYWTKIAFRHVVHNRPIESLHIYP